jgi:hypothetical protein
MRPQRGAGRLEIGRSVAADPENPLADEDLRIGVLVELIEFEGLLSAAGWNKKFESRKIKKDQI